MRKFFPFLLVAGSLCVGTTFAETPLITYKEYYMNLPDYNKNPPFRRIDHASSKELRDALSRVTPSTAPCVGYAFPEGDYSVTSNICSKDDQARLRVLLQGLAPSLDPAKTVFWREDLKNDGRFDLLIGYVTFSDEDPYFNLWCLRDDGDIFRSIYAGSFLMGSWYALERFGEAPSRKSVFVRFQNCTACCAWDYLTAIDFFAAEDGRPYTFTYDQDHADYGDTIEYVLPGQGHSVDAKVETRIPDLASGKHLIQHYAMADGKQEWWVFQCHQLKCDYQLYNGEPSLEIKEIWKHGKRI